MVLGLFENLSNLEPDLLAQLLHTQLPPPFSAFAAATSISAFAAHFSTARVFLSDLCIIVEIFLNTIFLRLIYLHQRLEEWQLKVVCILPPSELGARGFYHHPGS